MQGIGCTVNCLGSSFPAHTRDLRLVLRSLPCTQVVISGEARRACLRRASIALEVVTRPAFVERDAQACTTRRGDCADACATRRDSCSSATRSLDLSLVSLMGLGTVRRAYTRPEGDLSAIAIGEGMRTIRRGAW